ncbi:hypothetical protein CM19_13015 [Candidatus Acidianus copahuensis]|uniref:Uncharacterized protein n=1 Tax=Candidatus Acidianus copahuensis TaxID=1160895 RepID=A0A031LHA1_9CREN|nr:hypothetical protein CM19_13015 [Candidatus Acidianus copahuensis]
MARVTAPIAMLSLMGIFVVEGIKSGWDFSEVSSFNVNKASVLVELAFLAGNMSSWLTMAISIPDLTRFAVSQKSQMIGQLVLPFVHSTFNISLYSGGSLSILTSFSASSSVACPYPYNNIATYTGERFRAFPSSSQVSF